MGRGKETRARPPPEAGDFLSKLGMATVPFGLAYETLRRMLGNGDKPQTEIEQHIPERPPEADEPLRGPDPSRPLPPLNTPGTPAEAPPAPRREEYPIREPKKGEGLLITPDERDRLREIVPGWWESRHGTIDNRQQIVAAVGHFDTVASKVMPGSFRQTHGPTASQLFGYHEKYYPPAIGLPKARKAPRMDRIPTPKACSSIAA